MSKRTEDLKWWLKCLTWFFAISLAGVYILCTIVAHAADSGSDAPNWTSPTASALQKVSPIESDQSSPVLFENMDCLLSSYRTPSDLSVKYGCFTETANGSMDPDTSTMIFNGTDEAVPILPYGTHQLLAPWPKAQDLISLDSVVTGGTTISLYKNPDPVMLDDRNLLFQLVDKKLVAPAELPLRDASGNKLVINPATLAFSDNGSWLVAETYSGSFVRINLASLEAVPFASSFGALNSSGPLNARVAVTGNGRYIALANDIAQTLTVYDLSTCHGILTNVHANLPPQDCASHDFWPFVSTQLSGLRSIKHLRFVNDHLISFEVRSTNPDQEGTYELAPTDHIGSLIDYLGLGDSFTSGEGAFDYMAGSDENSNKCHLSIRSYPLLLTNDLFTSRGGHSVACSGATIRDVGSTSDDYRGQVKNGLSFTQLSQDQPQLLNSVMTNFLPGYVAQHRFVSQYQPGTITVSVGGDDVGFGDMLEKCVIYHVSLHISSNTCFNTYEDRLEVMDLVDRTVTKWKALYKHLHSESPGSRIYAIGYPQFVDDTGNCAINVHLDKSELEFAEEITDYINDAISQAAAQSGVNYVDISKALYGHRLCEAKGNNIAVNGLTTGNDKGPLGHESYHPNALGQQLMEQAILKQTHNLTTQIAPTASSSSADKLKQSPKSGRKTAKRVAATITNKIVKKGKATMVTSSGTATGSKPNTPYTVRLDGPTGSVVGSGNTDPDGNIDADITISDTTSPGGHTIDIIMIGQTGEDIDITQPIYIPVSDNDSDGDAVPDSSDSCPYAINSGQDADNDGIDDTCDGLIAEVSNNSGESSTGSGSVTGSTSQTTQGSQPNDSGTKTTNKLMNTKTTSLNSSTLQPEQLQSSVSKHTSSPHSLPRISWKALMALPVILWWLIVLGIWLGKNVSRLRFFWVQ